MIVIDTNVLSELMRTGGEVSVARWYEKSGPALRLPSVVLCEASYGIARLPSGRRKDALGENLFEWRERFADQMLAFGSETAMIFGDIYANAERAGRPMSFPDAQIAATAREHGAMLATRNLRDFSTTGLRLVDPWE